MYVITGAAGFISSCLLAHLNNAGLTDCVIVDDFSHPGKVPNYQRKAFSKAIERTEFPAWLRENAASVDLVFHLGARTDTTEQNRALLNELNLHYSQQVWNLCAQFQIPLIYASSAATYGGGEHGYEDNHDIITRLQPLNPYGDSKNDFDIWALQQPNTPPRWYGIKFFNVYGPNEYHKARMASVIFHTFNKVKSTGQMQLFRSHRPDFADGAQSRDFVYVKDVVQVLFWLAQHPEAPSGLYNLGTGQARTFLDLATQTFLAMGLQPNISFIDTPLDIRDTYQYFTEANMGKLRLAGYHAPFSSLEEGIHDYVQNYLMPGHVW